MEALRDVGLGALTWFLTLGIGGSVMATCVHYLGPPIADRARSFAFVAGGGMTLLLLVIAVGTFVGIYMSQRS